MVGGYGETTILNRCSISVKEGEITVIVGPNGAGKSTAMKAIFGMLSLRDGIVFFDDETINTPLLKVPHYDWQNRNFFIEPLKEVDCKAKKFKNFTLE